MGVVRTLFSAVTVTVLFGCQAHTPPPKSEPNEQLPASLSFIEIRTLLALRQKTPTVAPARALPQVQPEPAAERFRAVGIDSGKVPDFELLTATGTRLESQDVLGQQPVVLVFFATWCQLCEKKMPYLREALEEADTVRTIMVSVDDESTWFQAPDYLREQEIEGTLVSGRAHPNFVSSYNPFHAVPLVVIVGKDGSLVDYQMGFAEDHDQRLKAAIRIAASGRLETPKLARSRSSGVSQQAAKGGDAATTEPEP